MISQHPPRDRGRREKTFKLMVEHVRKFERTLVVETGTTANPSDHIGAGNSTELWNELELPAISIDIDPAAIKIAQFHYKKVHFICGDAPEVLRYMPARLTEDIRLLYLDSMWDPKGYQALRELEAIFVRLRPGCMIAIDDRHSDQVGKHVACQAWLADIGIWPVFKDYQIGWVKP